MNALSGNLSPLINTYTVISSSSLKTKEKITTWYLSSMFWIAYIRILSLHGKLVAKWSLADFYRTS